MPIYSLKQRVFMVKCYYQSGNSIENVQNEFIIKYNHIKPTDENIMEFVMLFENCGSVRINSDDVELEVNSDPINNYLEGDSEASDYHSVTFEEINIAKIEEESNDAEDFWNCSESSDRDLNGYPDFNIKLETENRVTVMGENSISNYVFETRRGLNGQEPVHLMKSECFECNKCGEGFLTELLLADHFKTHNETSLINEQPSENKPKSNHHIPLDENTFSFSVGNKSNKAIILGRQNSINTSDKYICNRCQTTFDSDTGLKNHINNMHKRQHQCSLCNNKYSSKTSLIIHMRTHTGEKPYSCSVCSRPFADSATCRRHERTHTGEKPHTCTICGKAFSRLIELKIHMANSHNQRCIFRTQIRCKVCDKTFGANRDLKNHMRKHTGEPSEKPYKCELCDNQYSSQTNLTIHKRSHTGEKPFICDVCGRLFVMENLLKLHYYNIHTPEKPFECEVCDKKYKTKKCLIIHNRTHTGEKPFICSLCSKRFGDRSSWRRHERTHSDADERPYKCLICVKAFCFQSNLKTHVKNVHKIDD